MTIISSCKSFLEAAWQEEQKKFSPPCLRCGRPLSSKQAENALSRYAEVYICSGCGTEEALNDAFSHPLPLEQWNYIATGNKGFSLLRRDCPFPEVFEKHEMGGQTGRNGCAGEFAYSRSDYDGRQWWTTWFPIHKEWATPEITAEVDAFTKALFQLPELRTLTELSRYCSFYAEPTSDSTEFNLYTQTEHFYIWLRPIIRDRDYNLYVHFYLKLKIRGDKTDDPN